MIDTTATCEICGHRKIDHDSQGCRVIKLGQRHECGCHKMFPATLKAYREMQRGEEVDRMATAYAYDEFLHRATMYALRLRVFTYNHLPHVKLVNSVVGGRV